MLKKTRVLLLIFFLTVILGAYGQNETTYLEWYKDFTSQKRVTSVEPLLSHGQTRLIAARAKHDGVAEVRALQEIGLVHLTQTHDYEQAMDFLIRALAIGDSLHLQIENIVTCLAMSKIFEEVGNYYKSSDFLQQALAINTTLDDVAVQVVILNELGKISIAMGKFDEASGYYQHVIAYKNRLHQPMEEAAALFNLAHLFQQEGNLKESLGYYRYALAAFRSLKSKKNEAQTLNNIGELYGAMKNKSKQMDNHVVALGIRQSLDDKEGIAESGNAIGALYYAEKNYSRAVANLGVALHAGQEIQDQDRLRKTYDLLSQCFTATGQFKQALEYKDLYIAMNDFIDHERNEQRLLEAHNRYALGKKQIEIQKLEMDNVRREQEIADQRQLRNVLIALVALSVVVVGLILVLYVNKRRSNASLTDAQTRLNDQNMALKELNATKDKFFSIIGHDLKGPLNSLSSFSNLLSNHLESLSQEEIKMLSKDLDKQLKNLFTLLENLLDWARSQTGSIEFTPEDYDIVEVLEDSKQLLTGQAQNKKIVFLGPENSVAIVRAHKSSIQTVVRNVLSNAIKFTPDGGVIKLEVNCDLKFATVSIADTGVGMSEDTLAKLFRIDSKHSTKGTANEKGTGLGLILCKDFVEKNNGKIWVESESRKGTVFYFTVPVVKQVPEL